MSGPHATTNDPHGTLYLDISCVRIQSYLSRSPRLSGRRGASAAISDATHVEEELAGFQEGEGDVVEVRLNTEAGEADGVVSLVLKHRPSGDTDAVAERLAHRVFRHLRRELPAAEFQAVWASGASYLDAYHHGIGPRLRRHEVLTDVPPVPELPYARVCTLCHIDPAWHELWLATDEKHTVCEDCRMRHSSDTKRSSRTTEEKLIEEVGASQRVPGLSDLAELGAPDSSHGNHVATAFIDGNAFGEFFQRLATEGAHLNPRLKTEISQELNAHTRTALAEAVSAVRRESDEGTLCAVPFLVGGDDVLVSLPADRAWRFIRHYLTCFGDLVEQTVAKAGLADPLALSASAGLVFSHATEAFSEVLEEASRRLSSAKSLVGGGAASVDFADLTANHTGGALRLRDLEGYAGSLDALAGLPASTRESAAALLRLPMASSEAESGAETHALRLGHEEVFTPFLSDEAPIRLSTALEITRWWRCPR